MASRFLFDGASGSECARIAAAFKQAGLPVEQVGSRTFWQYPSHHSGQSYGTPVRLGKFELNFISIYYDGKGVWLDLAGAKCIESNWDAQEMWNLLRYRVREGSSNLTTGLPGPYKR
jgi:hypothetical protein